MQMEILLVGVKRDVSIVEFHRRRVIATRTGLVASGTIR